MTHWEHPLLTDDTGFTELWARPREDPLLIVVGSGFDPRAGIVLERLVAATARKVDGLIIELPEDATDLAVRPLAQANRARITASIVSSGGHLHSLELPEYNDSRSLGRLVSRHFQESGLLDAYQELVIEISAMPRSLFFPLIRGVLQRAHLPADNPQHWEGDLHVAVCENPEADEGVLEEGTTAMAPIGGFAGARGETAATTIWVPVLGERASARVKVLYDELEPDETCPVLPWPARDPRRGDRLMLEYRRLLFEEIRIEPRNVIHAAERNPFDLYRTLGRLHERYLQSLRPLGSVAMVLSSHSSKLLSVGVLLTAYEHKLVVQHVSPGSYGLHDGAEDLRHHDEVYDLWLTGEPYR
ncbi:MAG: hypothetical protein WKF96_08465 [Solirubrobacteraceae bacterium]